MCFSNNGTNLNSPFPIFRARTHFEAPYEENRKKEELAAYNLYKFPRSCVLRNIFFLIVGEAIKLPPYSFFFSLVLSLFFFFSFVLFVYDVISQNQNCAQYLWGKCS